jgi:hypothetical protein
MSFCTAVMCMDGRVQLSVNAWLRERSGAEYVDTITEAGPDGILARRDQPLTDGIFERVAISVKAHGSRVIGMVAHADCAGHPVDEAEHRRHVLAAAERLREKFPRCEVLPLWVDAAWCVHEVQPEEEA